MALRRVRTTPRPITAATAVVSDDLSSWRTWKFGNTDWQKDAWRLYDLTPEHRFLANWIGDSVAQAQLYVTMVSETGEESGKVEDESISRLAALPLGAGSQRDDCLRLAGIDLAVGGECWIVGEDAARSPESARVWYVLTGESLRRTGDEISVRRPKTQGGGRLVLRNGVDVLIRCWRPHPNDSDQADSPTRPAIVPMREVELLTKAEFATLDSRLTGAGVWFLPEGIDFPRGPDDPDGLPGFMAYVQRAVMASIRNPGDARAVVPVMATIPDAMMEHMDKFRPITFWSEFMASVPDTKEKAIRRIANAFEIPSELLLGMSTANHWTAWAISEEGVKRIRTYLAPIADALTRGFLRIALSAMGVADPERYAFAFDTAPLAARPNRLEDALQLHDRFLLSDDDTVRAGAFDTRQMPTADERIRMLLLRVVQQKPDLLGDPAIQAALGIPRIPGLVSQEPTPVVREQRPAIEGESGPPSDGDPGDGPPGALAASAAIADSPAVNLLVYRALELAGGRLTTPADRRLRWPDTPRCELHVEVGAVGPDRADRVLNDAWPHVPLAATDLSVDAESLRDLLHRYVRSLLTTGTPHSGDRLRAAAEGTLLSPSLPRVVGG